MANFFAQASSGFDIISTQTKPQQQLTNRLLQQANQRVGKFRPFQAPTRRLAPTAGEASVFAQGRNLLGRINQSTPSQGVEGARRILQGGQGGQRGQPQQQRGGSQQGGQQKPEESIAEILTKGLTGVLQKVVQLVGGRGA